MPRKRSAKLIHLCFSYTSKHSRAFITDRHELVAMQRMHLNNGSAVINPLAIFVDIPTVSQSAKSFNYMAAIYVSRAEVIIKVNNGTNQN